MKKHIPTLCFLGIASLCLALTLQVLIEILGSAFGFRDASSLPSIQGDDGLLVSTILIGSISEEIVRLGAIWFYVTRVLQLERHWHQAKESVAVIYGLAYGLSFGLIEPILYLAKNGLLTTSGVDTALALQLLGVTCIHTVLSIIVFVSISRISKNNHVKQSPTACPRKRIPLILLTTITLHIIYNFLILFLTTQ